MGIMREFILAVLMLFAVPLAVYSAAPPPAMPGTDTARNGTISGQLLTTGGEPLAGGMVYFYNKMVGPPPDHEKYWRVPDFKKRLDNEGKLSTVLPEGEYYMSTTRRVSGKAIGPLQEGDDYFISTDGQGHPIVYSVRKNGQLDLGRIDWAVPFKKSTVNYGKGITAIEGVVLDNQGNPVAGAFVVAFVSAGKGGKPLFIADPTGKDGSFILRVHDAGSYYLKVRSKSGDGPPVPGELIGFYGEKQPAAVTVKKGERLTGFTIKVSIFAGRGLQRGAKEMLIQKQ